ncbi:MAG: fibronectin type III-like domain-contianing protein, partial [Bacteroidota bacterium]
NKAAFPFGFGLSYTTFQQDSASVEVNNDVVQVSTLITNTGERAGDQVVQLYIGFDNSNVEREHKLLKAFQRITLAQGETKRVQLSCPLEALRWYNPSSKTWELEQMTYQAYIGTSSDERELSLLTFEVSSDLESI